MTVEIFRRVVSANEGWTSEGQRGSFADAENSIVRLGLTMSHGDLVRLVGQDDELLFVFSGARGKLVEVRDKKCRAARDPNWVELWEGAEASSWSMLDWCSEVSLRRLALVACDLADTTSDHRGPNGDGLRRAVESVRAWLREEASFGDVREARRACRGMPTYEARTNPELVASAASCAANAACATIFGDSLSASKQAMFGGFYAADCVLAARRHAEGWTTLHSDEERRAVFREQAEIVRKHIPLCAFACSLVHEHDPLPVVVASQESR